MRARTAWPKVICLTAALLPAALAGCGSKSSGDEGDTGGNANAVAEVTVTRVTRADISRLLTLTGAIMATPNHDVRVSAQVAGRVAELKVAEGDAVKAGEIVARIDDRPYRDQLRQAEAASAQAAANLENAKLTLARNQNLVERGIAARKDLDDARTQAAVAQAAVQQSDAALALARLQIQRTEVASPLDGIVVKRFASVGEQVDGTAAQPLVEIAQLGEVELAGNVPATYLGSLHAGESIAFTTEAFPGRRFTGRVAAISPAVDPTTNAGLVRVRIANPGGTLRLGMFLSAQVALQTHAKALVVPPQAIYKDEAGELHVYRVTGTDSVSVPVKVGIETPEMVELLSGVQEGDQLILSGGYGLPDKAKVTVKGAPAS